MITTFIVIAEEKIRSIFNKTLLTRQRELFTINIETEKTISQQTQQQIIHKIKHDLNCINLNIIIEIQSSNENNS